MMTTDEDETIVVVKSEKSINETLQLRTSLNCLRVMAIGERPTIVNCGDD